MTMELLLPYIFGGTSLVGGIGWLLSWRENKRKQLNEARMVETSAIAAMQQTLEHALKMYDDLVLRAKDYQRTIDEQVTRCREISDRLYKSEQTCNGLAERNHEQGERLAGALLELEHMKHWHCRRCDCRDPRGREPKQDPPESSYQPFRYEKAFG